MNQLNTAFAMCVALCCTPLLLHGQTSNNAAELAAVRQTAKSYLEAFDRGDAKGIAALWTEDGEYIDQTGLAFQGREVIEKAFEEFFSKTKGAKLQLHIESLHLAQENLAVEVGDSSMTHAGGKAAELGRYRAIHVKQDGTWRLQSVHEGPGLPPSNYQHLKGLEWMIGSWVDEEVHEDKKESSVVVHTNSRWSVNRNFIVRDFTATVDGRVTAMGTQRIAWYAPSKQIRSWTFTSDGAITVGVWSKNGEQWVVKTEQILRDGKKSEETETVTINDLHSHTWRLTERVLDGKRIPDQTIEVNRLGTKKS